MLGQQPVLTQAGSPARYPSPSIIISHRQAGRVRLGWVRLGWAALARVRPSQPLTLRDASGSKPPAASLGIAEVRGRRRKGYPGGPLGAPWGVTWLDWEPPWPWPLLSCETVSRAL